MSLVTKGMETIATGVKELIAIMRLPQAQLSTFKGSSHREYWEFICALHHYIWKDSCPEGG